MDIERARAIVAKQGWLPKTPRPFREALLSRCILQEMQPGDVICRVGDPPGGLYGLVEGSLGILVSRAEKAPSVIHFARPGTWFGEACAMTGEPRRVGLVAARATALMHVPLPRLLELMSKDPDGWRCLALITLEHADTAVAAGNDLMLRDPDQRMAAVLLRLTGCRASTPPGDLWPLQAAITQDEIATLANMARNTAGAILKRFNAAGYVKLKYRVVEVKQPDRLRDLLVE